MSGSLPVRSAGGSSDEMGRLDCHCRHPELVGWRDCFWHPAVGQTCGDGLLKRVECDIYGYPIYEPQESSYVIQSPDGKVSAIVTATSELEAGKMFMELLSWAMNDGLFIKRTN